MFKVLNTAAMLLTTIKSESYEFIEYLTVIRLGSHNYLYNNIKLPSLTAVGDMQRRLGKKNKNLPLVRYTCSRLS